MVPVKMAGAHTTQLKILRVQSNFKVCFCFVFVCLFACFFVCFFFFCLARRPAGRTNEYTDLYYPYDSKCDFSDILVNSLTTPPTRVTVAIVAITTTTSSKSMMIMVIVIAERGKEKVDESYDW